LSATRDEIRITNSYEKIEVAKKWNLRGTPKKTV